MKHFLHFLLVEVVMFLKITCLMGLLSPQTQTAAQHTTTLLQETLSDDSYNLHTHSRKCLDLSSEEIPYFDPSLPDFSEEDLTFCLGNQRLSLREYVLLPYPLADMSQQENFLSPHLSTTISLAKDTVLTLSQSPRVDVGGTGGLVNIVVDSLLDSAANATSCGGGQQQVPGSCNYRSAVAYCQLFLTAPLNYCTINLPAFETLIMDPHLGDVNLTEVTGYLTLVSERVGGRGMMKSNLLDV
jgi:hypothetical protein